MRHNSTTRYATRQPPFLLPDTATPPEQIETASLPSAESEAVSPRRGRDIVTERTLDESHDDQPSDEPADKDSAASSLDQAKEREREMEESGEENAG